MTAMRCHYEVLEVSMDCSVDELKQAYRRLARTWHPDKNYHQTELAEAKFKEIQAAYEVLSDPAERTWYDQHRDAILAGVDAGDEYEGVNIWPYFSSSCYGGFDDSETGFYTIYKNLFSVLDLDEKKSNPNGSKAPFFGESTSPYESVKQFYAHWMSFSTTKSFSWKDVYKVTEAPNRQIRRIMERENKKERDRAKKAYNELVRRLIAYVRRQDKRLMEYIQAEQKEKEERDAKKKAEQQRNKESMKKELEMAKKLAEERLDKLDLNEFETELDEKDKQKVGLVDNEILELYCYACKKKFKSDKQWANHEKSKKHIIAVEKMRQEILVEDDILEDTNSKDDLLDSLDLTNEEEIIESVDSIEANSSTSLTDENLSEKATDVDHSGEASDIEHSEDYYMDFMMRSNKNNNNNMFSMYEDIMDEEDSEEEVSDKEVEKIEVVEVLPKKKQSRRNKKKRN